MTQTVKEQKAEEVSALRTDFETMKGSVDQVLKLNSQVQDLKKKVEGLTEDKAQMVEKQMGKALETFKREKSSRETEIDAYKLDLKCDFETFKQSLKAELEAHKADLKKDLEMYGRPER